MGDFVVATNHLYDDELNYMGNYVMDLYWFIHERKALDAVMQLSETATLSQCRREDGCLELTVTTPECVMIYVVDW